jgi:predicted  nucleic acid-binding Zn-ribbon protein
MKKLLSVNLIILFTAFLFTGCVTTQNIKSTFTSVDELYSKVPEDQREKVQDAQKHLDIAKEKLKLAELNKEMATKQEKLRGYEKKLAELTHKGAATGVEMAKWETIDELGMGKKEKNIKSLYNLRAKISKLETNAINIQRDQVTTELHIEQLVKQIEDQEEKLKSMESSTSKLKEWLKKLTD